MSAEMQSNLIDVFSTNAEIYDSGSVEFFKPLARELVQIAGISAGQRVLDVGSGRGAVLFELARRVGDTGHVTGIDIAEGMVESTTHDIETRGLTNTTLHLMDGQDPDFPARSFDAITGSMSIIMIPDLPSALANYHALLADHGVLAFSAPAPRDGSNWTFGPFDMREFIGEALGNSSEDDTSAMHGFLDQFAGSRLGDILAELRAAGFNHPRAHPVPLTISANSGKELVDWTFSHGMRVVWDSLPEARRTELRHKFEQQIDADADTDGVIRYPIELLVYTAQK